MGDVGLRLAFEEPLVPALAEACGRIDDKLGVGGEWNRWVSSEIEAVKGPPVRAGRIGSDLKMNEVMLPVVVASHGVESLPVHALFIDAEPTPGGFMLENLVGELIDARCGFAGAGVASDEPAPAELAALPDQAWRTSFMARTFREQTRRMRPGSPPGRLAEGEDWSNFRAGGPRGSAEVR